MSGETPRPASSPRLIYHIDASDLGSLPDKLKALRPVERPDQSDPGSLSFEEWREMERVIRERSSRWREEPLQLPMLVARGLLSRGWSQERLSQVLPLVGAALTPGPGDELFTLSRHTASVKACAITPDGRRAVSASDDQTLVVWDLSSYRALRVLSGHQSPVRACAITPDGRKVVSGSVDRTLKVWDLDSESEPRTLSGHSEPVWTCAISSDGNWLISGSADCTLRVWDLARGEVLTTLRGHTKAVWSCAVTMNGRYVVSSSVDNTLRIWDLEQGTLLHTLPSGGGPLWSCVTTPDSQQVIVGTDDGTVRGWEIVSGREILTLAGHRGPVLACSLDRTGTRLVTGSEDGTLKLWDLPERRECLSLIGHHGAVSACAATPDGRLAVSGSADATVKVWDLVSRRQIPCALTSDGKRVISSWRDNRLVLFDVRSGVELLSSVGGHTAPIVECIAIPDSPYALSRAANGEHKIWELDEIRPPRVVAPSTFSEAGGEEAVELTVPSEAEEERKFQCVDTAKGPGDFMFLPATEVLAIDTQTGSNRTWRIRFSSQGAWSPASASIPPVLGDDMPSRLRPAAETPESSGFTVPLSAGFLSRHSALSASPVAPGAPSAAPVLDMGSVLDQLTDAPPLLLTSAMAAPEVLFAWLHLADLQVGRGSAEQQVEQGRVQDALQQDVAGLLGNVIPSIDALLLSGDLAFAGDPAEYARVRPVLESLAGAAGINLRRVYAVPGNHDVERRRHGDRNLRRMLQVLRMGVEEVDEVLSNPVDRELLLSRFQGFRQLARALALAALDEEEDALQAWSLPMAARAGLAVRIVGLNTALLCMDDDDQGRLRLPPALLERRTGLAASRPDELVIALSHHPLHADWLADQGALRAWLQGRVHVNLCGHNHEGDLRDLRAGGGQGVIHVATGGDPREGGKIGQGYNLAAVVQTAEGLVLRVWPRRYSERNGRFITDMELVGADARYREHPLRGLALPRGGRARG